MMIPEDELPRAFLIPISFVCRTVVKEASPTRPKQAIEIEMNVDVVESLPNVSIVLKLLSESESMKLYRSGNTGIVYFHAIPRKPNAEAVSSF
jgi:hypothetical protein